MNTLFVKCHQAIYEYLFIINIPSFKKRGLADLTFMKACPQIPLVFPRSHYTKRSSHESRDRRF